MRLLTGLNREAAGLKQDGRARRNCRRLILCFGVMAPGSCDQGCDECPEKGFSAFAHIMNELEEAKVEG